MDSMTQLKSQETTVLAKMSTLATSLAESTITNNVLDSREQKIKINEHAAVSPSKEKAWAQRIIFITLLVVSTLGAGGIGTTVNMLDCEESLTKNQWRFGCSVIILIPPVVFEVLRGKGKYFVEVRAALTVKNILMLLVTPTLLLQWSLSLIYGSERIIQSHAYILTSISSVFMVFINCCLGLRPHRAELVGLGFIVGGITLLFNDDYAERTDGQRGSLHVYALCIGSSFLACFYYILNGKLIKVLPVFTLNFLSSLLNFIYCGIAQTIMKWDDEDSYEFFSIDK